MKKIIFYNHYVEPGKDFTPVEVIWEGDDTDEQGLVEAFSDFVAELFADDARKPTGLLCGKLTREFDDYQVTIGDFVQALADGETTFRVFHNEDVGIDHEYAIFVV